MIRRRLLRVGLVLLLVALAGSVFVNVLLWKRQAALSRRLDALEKLAATREAADPLMPWECEIADGLGMTPERPCQVEFPRLYQSPQQFVGRWVLVKGRYASGFEMSALFSPYDALTVETADRLLHENRALWLSPGLPGDGMFREVDVVGKFKRGPAGHLGQYFGELAGVKTW